MAARQKSARLVEEAKSLQDALPPPCQCSAERARIALHEATESRAFARAAFRLLSATAPGEFTSAQFHCSPAPQWGLWLSSNGVTISPGLMREISKVNPTIPVLCANPGITVSPTRDVLPPEEELVQTPFYRIFMKPLNWRHAVALFFWKTVSPPELDCVLSVYRTEEQGDFSHKEISQLAALHPDIERARLRVTKLEEQRAALRSLQHFVRNLPVPAMMLNWQLKVLYQNREALDYCTRWQGRARAGSLKPVMSLPLELCDACREMKIEWGKHLARNGFTRLVRKRVILCQGCAPLRVTISMMQLAPTLLGDPNFLVVFEGSSPSGEGHPGSPMFAKLAKLTAREREVALLVTEGISNQDIADRLGRCVGTVKAELHAAYMKLGVTSRAQLLLKILNG